MKRWSKLQKSLVFGSDEHPLEGIEIRRQCQDVETPRKPGAGRGRSPHPFAGPGRGRYRQGDGGRELSGPGPGHRHEPYGGRGVAAEKALEPRRIEFAMQYVRKIKHYYGCVSFSICFYLSACAFQFVRVG